MVENCKKRLIFCAIIALIPFVGLSGCSAGDQPSAERLAEDLQNYFSANPICSHLAVSFPAEIQSFANDPYRELITSLEAHGLLKRAPSHRPNELVKSNRFELTEEGKKYLRPNRDKYLGGSQLCYAYRNILSVDSISDAQRDGRKVITVQYTYEVKSTAIWATDPGVWRVGLLLAKSPYAQRETSSMTMKRVEKTWVPV